jgi:hypothetical protein
MAAAQHAAVADLTVCGITDEVADPIDHSPGTSENIMDQGCQRIGKVLRSLPEQTEDGKDRLDARLADDAS